MNDAQNATEVMLMQGQDLAPMAAAKMYVTLTRRKRALDADLIAVRREIADLEQRILHFIAEEMLPETFRVEGGSTHTRETVRASAKDGDHARLAKVLEEVGLTEYLPSTVNANSISAYVREHYNRETGEFDDEIDPRLLDALNVTKQVNVVVLFNK